MVKPRVVNVQFNNERVYWGDYANHILADTWEWDGATWTQKTVAGPPSRWHYGMTPFGGKLVLFGGDGGVGKAWLGDTWEYDGTAWTQRTVTGPSARYTYTLAAR